MEAGKSNRPVPLMWTDAPEMTVGAPSDTPEMTVGDSSPLHEIYTDKAAGEDKSALLVSCICPKCGTTWFESVLLPLNTAKLDDCDPSPTPSFR